MNTLRKRIGIGYAVITIVIAAIAYIGVSGWRRQAQWGKMHQKTEMYQQQIGKIEFNVMQLSLMGEAVIDWDSTDFNKYHARCLELDRAVFTLTGSEPSVNGQADSLRLLLESKERHLCSIMELLDRQNALNEQIARQVPMIAKRSTQEKPKKGKRKILGLFGHRKQPKQAKTTAMLHNLDKKIISRHKEQSRRIREYADSLTERNKLLTRAVSLKHAERYVLKKREEYRLKQGSFQRIMQRGRR